ncbi:ABC transporter permease [Vallitalea pronyensis]|uniref:ABC transporter permease n=1 Tax=Vallitalea pronyensis TaxID=1348613 RepID=A0A8J8MJF4_9FIRM|nr:ABC transporter permease [Vallitalea pronyensis]QUI22373.1 ABC transporter permease [Vallitalea pronyensis]
MKLWHSFIKELKLASRGFYFYIEFAMAAIILVVLLFLVPEEFSSTSDEYLYLDLPEAAKESLNETLMEGDLDNHIEQVEIKSKKQTYQAQLYHAEGKKIYVLDNAEDVVTLAKNERQLGAIITLGDDNRLHYTYYLQGYESQRLRNLYLIYHNKDIDILHEHMDNLEVRSIDTHYGTLTDRQNIIPALIAINGSFLGLFIIAAYIFLDKQEGIIKAYAITASSVWQYLMSKVGVLLFSSLLSTLIIVIPLMGLQVNYFMFVIVLLTSSFFASAVGLLIGSCFKNMMQAFGAIYGVMIVMMLPNIAYFIPSWEPLWVKVIPTYPLIQSFKETILQNGDMHYVGMTSLGFFIAGIILFLISNMRYKKTMTV